MRIDAHQHYWEINKGYYDWINPSEETLYQDYQPDDLSKNLQSNKIKQTIAVQASPLLEDTQYLLQLSEKNDSIAGVVGWVDLLSDTFKEDLGKWKQHPKFVGIRVMIQDMENAAVILNKEYVDSFIYLESKQIPVDLLIREKQLPDIVHLLNRVPSLKAVVDHMAKPDIASGDIEFWKRYLGEVASFENVYCKVSGLVTEAKQEWKREDFTPYIQHAVQVFGVDRVLFGSDWPVCLLAATYDEVIEIVEEALSTQCKEQEMGKLFGANAAKFYGLTNP
ncbi:amidohydrolase family protein [Alkalicoccobacillus porphyridii]|uniref:Amidohydrolase family protein n=1 Tax=Alkalicoccobacillus porphyridii TaxID=2597270 RepID=A0A554A021_9BACI|nr:amidohydrolase family protein [Alkalicoccobacillus porphyridii]TSB47040.1 amidohydrolase family protein [Alkalicoccobacillus porphyridii]